MFDIGVAVAGAGFIGPVHVEALRRLGIPVVGLLSSSPEKTRRIAGELSIPAAYADFDELLRDPKVHAVHLAVPNLLHFEMSKKTLEAGKHVMCEKPLAMNARESEALVELARDRKLAAGVCYNVRYYPLNQEVRERISGGEIGNIHSINGSYVQDWLLYEADYNWRVLSDQGGELRAVADIGTHWMDLVLSITGLEVEAVFADLNTVHAHRRRPRGEVETFSGKMKKEEETESIDIATDDYGAILFRFTNGAKGSLWVSQMTAGRKNCIRYEIAGSKSSMAWNSENPNELWMGHRDRANETLIRDPSLLSPTARAFVSYPGGHNEGFADTFKQCFRTFYEYIANGEFSAAPAFPTFAEGHREIRLCEAILRSHREQRWINL